MSKRSRNPVVRIWNSMKSVYDNRVILMALIRRNTAGRYKSTYVGFGWHLLMPVLMIVVLYIAFNSIRTRPIEDYWIYLSSGMFPIMFISGCLRGRAIQSNASYITKMHFPREIVILASVITDFLSVVFAYVFIIMIILSSGQYVNWWGMAVMSYGMTVILYDFPVGMAIFLVTMAVGMILMIYPMVRFFDPKKIGNVRFEKMGSGKGWEIAILTAAIVIIPTAVLFETVDENGEIDISVGDSSVRVTGPMVDETIAYSEIADIRLDGDFQRGSRIAGYSDSYIQSGNFRNSGGNYTLAAYCSCGACIVIEDMGGHTYAFNQKTEQSTQELYDTLVEKTGF